MYASGGFPPVVGGIAGSTLAYTGSGPVLPIIIIALSLLLSGALLLRTTYLRRHTAEQQFRPTAPQKGLFL